MVATRDFVSNLDEVLVVKSLHHIDEQRGVTCLDGAVELAHVTQSDDFVELDVIGESLEQLGLRLPLCHLIDVVAVRTYQQHAVLVGYQVKDLEHARRGHQRAVEAIDDVVELVIDGIELIDAFQQPHLVLKALFAEHLNDIGRETLAAQKWHIGIDDLGHALLELGDDLGCQEFLFMLDLAIVAVADAVLDAQALAGVQVVERLVEHHAQRARVHAETSVGHDIDELDVLGREDGIMQILNLVVDKYAHSVTLEADTPLDGLIQVEERVATVNAQVLVRVLAEHLEFIVFFHTCANAIGFMRCKVTKKSLKPVRILQQNA